MSRRKFEFLLLTILLGSLAIIAKTGMAVAQDLLPSEWIVSETLVLEQRGDQANVHFPVPPDDERPAFENAFPVVAMLQGAQVDKSQYDEFGRQLARHGFVVVIPNHFQVLGPPGTPPILAPDQFVVLDVLAQMELEDADATSLLYRIVDTERLALTGHSLGGVVGLFVIEGSCNPPFCFGFFQRPAALRAGAFYGTNSVDPVSGELIDIDTGNIPVALDQGSLDSLATPSEAKDTFEILDGPRSLITLKDANHFGICDMNNPPGAEPDPVDPRISQSDAIQCVARSVGLFLRIHVKDEPIDESELKCKAKKQ